MSLSATIWAWRQKTTGSTAKYVLLALADRVRGQGRCSPTHAEIASDCQLSTRAVFDALKSLEADGLITRTKRSNGKQRFADMIQVNLSRIVLFENGPDSECTENASWEEAESANRTVQIASGSAPPPAANATPLPIREDPIEKEKIEPQREPDLSVLAARIYDSGTDRHRDLCKGDPGKIRWALRDAVERGDDPVRVTDAMVAFVTSGDQQKPERSVSPVTAIRDGRWLNWVWRPINSAPPRDLSTEARPVTEITHDGHTYAVPDGGQTKPVGTWEHPGLLKQLGIMQDWNKRIFNWQPRWGTPPGAEGCRMWPSVLERFPHESVGVGPGGRTEAA